MFWGHYPGFNEAVHQPTHGFDEAVEHHHDACGSPWVCWPFRPPLMKHKEVIKFLSHQLAEHYLYRF